jgi:hypothetical protein
MVILYAMVIYIGSRVIYRGILIWVNVYLTLAPAACIIKLFTVVIYGFS